MCQIKPFTLSCCGLLSWDIERTPSCPASWGKERCPGDLCIVVAPSDLQQRDTGGCWRCKNMPHLQPHFNFAKTTLGLQERTPQERRREIEAAGACCSCQSTYGCGTCGSKRPDAREALGEALETVSEASPAMGRSTYSAQRHKKTHARPESLYDVKKRAKGKGKEIKKESTTRTTRSASLRTPGRVTKPYNHSPRARPNSVSSNSSFYDISSPPGFPPSGPGALPSPAGSENFIQSPFGANNTSSPMYPNQPTPSQSHLQVDHHSFHGMSHAGYAANLPTTRSTANNGSSRQFHSPPHQPHTSSPLTKMESSPKTSAYPQHRSPKLGSPFHSNMQTPQDSPPNNDYFASHLPGSNNLMEEDIAEPNQFHQHYPQNEAIAANFDHSQDVADSAFVSHHGLPYDMNSVTSMQQSPSGYHDFTPDWNGQFVRHEGNSQTNDQLFQSTTPHETVKDDEQRHLEGYPELPKSQNNYA
ncbi:hypothetical protein GLAREA_02809 [Glarea lozoyensis ATCC 20868]|uniref:Uncharacterized protein n=1 Tax=Glarea lozoyensis (strain ATCC 20868 / MF5171) TaxID=1116229 RepID=S3CMF4_GLAL2|nr:uncharacterized protein GLAREA_02809 [Glarea lozoyensis ATCC 20868]EPE26895.1 hypothetical protein GLAREA_02809 [Glarea lozoyensis ATCC 20868]